MYIVKVLKRRDAASVVVAVVLAMILLPVLQSTTAYLASDLVGTNSVFGAAPSWKELYLQPLVAALFQVVLLELGLRLMVALRAILVRRVK
ncbi:MAG: hypothetical protein M3Q14_03590 [bacterium]|nr:hypothetical protein [bacterium]